MGVIISPESEMAKELQKWEMFPRYNANGEVMAPGNPYRADRMYPKMLYKAQERPNGKIECMTNEPNPRFYKDPTDYDFAVREAQAFNRECYRIVPDESEHTRARANGWRETVPEAIAFLNGLKDDIAREAAEAAFRAKGMSSKARAELEAVGESTHEHVVDITVKKKRGRKPKVQIGRASWRVRV